MSQVNIDEAKAKLPQLLVRVEAGEEVIIARAGHPIARISGVKQTRRGRILGQDAGLFAVPDDFNAPGYRLRLPGFWVTPRWRHGRVLVWYALHCGWIFTDARRAFTEGPDRMDS